MMLTNAQTIREFPASAPAISGTDHWAYQRQPNGLDERETRLRAGFESRVRFYRSLLGKFLPANKDEAILDLPCGEGQMLYTLHRLGYSNLKGFDIDARRVAVGRRLDLPTFEGNVFDILLAHPNASISCVVSMDFIEHIEKEDVVRLLDLVQRRLRPGGRLILRTPCADSPFGSRHIHNDFTHKWAATSGVLRGLLTSGGFVDVAVFGEHPKVDMRRGVPRVLSFWAASFMGNMITRALNIGRIEIWSSSMWAIATKP